MEEFKPLDLFDKGLPLETDLKSDAPIDSSSESPETDSNDEPKDGAIPEDDSKVLEGASKELEQVETEPKEDDDTETTDEVEPETVLEMANDAYCDVSEPIVESENACDKLAVMYEQLSKKITSLEELFNKRIMYTAHEEKVIDQMHNELQKYKEDLYSQLVRPILMDVIEVRDSIMRISATYLKKPEEEQSIPNKVFAGYAYDLQDILEKNNIEIYKSVCGEIFQPLKQRVVRKEVTDDESLHGKVAESLSCGYSYGERIISPEKIAVYFYQENQDKNKETNKESEDNENG